MPTQSHMRLFDSRVVLDLFSHIRCTTVEVEHGGMCGWFAEGLEGQAHGLAEGGSELVHHCAAVHVSQIRIGQQRLHGVLNQHRRYYCTNHLATWCKDHLPALVARVVGGGDVGGGEVGVDNVVEELQQRPVLVQHRGKSLVAEYLRHVSEEHRVRGPSVDGGGFN